MGDALARWMYGLLENKKRISGNILYNSTVRDDLRTLEPTKNVAKRQKEYVLGKLSLCMMIVVIGVFLTTIMWIKETSQTKLVDNKIYRNPYGEGAKQVEVIADNGEASHNLKLNIEERIYSNEEINTLMAEFIPLLETEILGQNESFDKVEYSLMLVDELSGFPFMVEWRVDEEYIDYEGNLVKNRLDTPKLTEIKAVISYEDFLTEHVFNCMVYSKAVAPQWHEVLLNELKSQEGKNRSSDYIELPKSSENIKLSWKYKRSYTSIFFLVATPIITIILFYGKDKDLHKQVDKRREQMLLDYPELVSSLALLIGAGMTVPNAWDKVARDYSIKKQQTKKIRFTYEEMLLTVYEMESGVVQTKAYERFGRRCRIPNYNKLATMLSQNLKKGSVNLPILLRNEAFEAFNERKHAARKLGEKAGTKLLVPMMMLLIMSMAVIMLPAFINL